MSDKIENSIEKELLKQIPKTVHTPSFLDLQADVNNVRLEAMEARIKAEALEPNRGLFIEPRNPLTEIYAKYLATVRHEKAELVCPDCGEPDHGNKMNKRSWCIKCNVPLVHKSKKLRKKQFQVRVVKKEKNPTFLEEP